MNKKLIILASSTFLILSPALYSIGLDAGHDTMMVQDTKVVSDADLTKAVKDAFIADSTIAAFADKVEVAADKGVVTLSGKVDSEKTKLDFGVKARGVAGVDRVVNDIEIAK